MTTNRPEKLDEALIRPGRVDHQVAFGNATQTQIKELFERMYTNDLPRTTFIKSGASTIASPKPTSLQIIKEKEEILTPPLTPTTATHEHANGSANGHALSNGHAVNGHAKMPNGVIVLGEKDNGEVSEEELRNIAKAFSVKVPDDMFSPAEIQGFLLKRKKDPRKALAEVENWVESMKEVKRKGTKLVKVQ
jgi:chaperone BCS1